jgi:hypothetical protein
MESSPLIYKAVLAVMAKATAIEKDRKNENQHYNFRGIDETYNALHGPMVEEGIFSTSTILDSRTETMESQKGGVLLHVWLKMKYTFWAADGSKVETEVVGEAMDSGDKASNKAMAVAHKYALLQIFAVPTIDQKDPEVDSPLPAASKPAPFGTKAQAPAAKPAAQAAKTPAPASKPAAKPEADIPMGSEPVLQTLLDQLAAAETPADCKAAWKGWRGQVTDVKALNSGMTAVNQRVKSLEAK